MTESLFVHLFVCLDSFQKCLQFFQPINSTNGRIRHLNHTQTFNLYKETYPTKLFYYFHQSLCNYDTYVNLTFFSHALNELINFVESDPVLESWAHIGLRSPSTEKSLTFELSS
jgi:hypothetical protein